MSEIFISPGVYTREYDYSYYVSSVNNSSLAIVGETEAGPAFKPTKVTNIAEFKEKFGPLSTAKLAGYCARSYFKYANQAYIVRVLGSESLRGANTLIAIKSAAADTLAILMVEATVDAISITDTSSTDVAAASTSDLWLTLGTTADPDSIYDGWINLYNESSPVYIGAVFPRDSDCLAASTATQAGAATQMVFPNAMGDAIMLETDSGSTHTFSVAVDTFVVSGYTGSQSPMIVGEESGGRGKGLFTVYSQSDGEYANKSIKIEISDIDPVSYTFSLSVRDFSDTNAQPITLEKFTKLSLTKSSDSYIERTIGDNVNEEIASYALVSKYIYVQCEQNDSDQLKNNLPYGFNDVVGSATEFGDFPEFGMNTVYTSASIRRQSLGLNIEDTDLDMLMARHGSQRDITSTGDTLTKGFHLNSTASGTYYQSGPLALGSTGYTKFNMKFVAPMLGGNDGWANEDTTRELLDPDNASGTTIRAAFQRAFDTIASAEEYDINLLAVPGVAITSAIGEAAIDLAQGRADCFYVGDMPNNATSAENAATKVTALDSNYAATYWPYVKIYDSDTREEVLIPPTPQVLEAIAYTDQNSYPWMIPAGMNRGLLTDVIRTEFKLTQDDRDTLYANKINPIATLPGQGYAIWGQKTLQTRTTALDRINVRRMMIYVEKIIAGVTLYLVFEQNDSKTRDRFLNMVQPILDRIKIKRGLYDFRVICDETNNTPEMIDRGQMNGDIWLKPTKGAEAIKIGFNLMDTGASFDEIEG